MKRREKPPVQRKHPRPRGGNGKICVLDFVRKLTRRVRSLAKRKKGDCMTTRNDTLTAALRELASAIESLSTRIEAGGAGGMTEAEFASALADVNAKTGALNALAIPVIVEGSGGTSEPAATRQRR